MGQRVCDALNNGPDADWQAVFRAHHVDQMVMGNFLGRDNSNRLLRGGPIPQRGGSVTRTNVWSSFPGP